MQIICLIFVIIMNIEYFISKKLFSAKKKNNSYTKPILSIAIIAIALSLSVMLISVMVVTGFRNEIASKIIGFGSHITVSNFINNQSYNSEPISINQDFYTSYDKSAIRNINVFAIKPAIIKTDSEIHGVVLKGISSDYNWDFFNSNLKDGNVLNITNQTKSNGILISEYLADFLGLGLKDDLVMYFVQDPPRVRKFNITGIYNTALVDFDKLYVLADIKHIQTLNSWPDSLVGGFEVNINNFDDLENITKLLYEQIPYDLNAQNIKETSSQVFDWLDLQDINVRVILILMLIVGVMNMITALLILILERTRVIGILKALGASDWSVRRIFLYSAMNLIFKGLLIGNTFAFTFALSQKWFSLFSLNPETYYMTTVPINFDFLNILMINVGTVFISYIVLIIPSIIITKITPIKAIRFE